MSDLAPDLIDHWRAAYGLDTRTPGEAMRWWSDNNIGQAPAGAVAALGLCLDEIDRLTDERDQYSRQMMAEDRRANALDAEISRLAAERDEWRDADRAECAANARLRAQLAETRTERDAAELSRDAAHAECARLTQRVADWEGAAQMGHTSPCTLGPNCPYCECARLTQRVAEFPTLVRALEKQSAQFSRLDYAISPPNEMQTSLYDVDCDEERVVNAAIARLAEGERTIARLSGFKP